MVRVPAILIALTCAVSAFAAEIKNVPSGDPNVDAAGVTPPRVFKLSSSLPDAPAGVSGLVLSIYKDREGGHALWTETQNVDVDANGQFTVFIGASDGRGVPLEMFSSGEARWLGIQRVPENEQPRILLASVPYALKAGDADTLGGKPLSAFLLNDSSEKSGGKQMPKEISGIAG